MVGTSVLVGVDGSPEARDAAIQGQRIALAASGSLHLATAVTDLLADVAFTRFGLDIDRLHQALLQQARGAVEENLLGLFEPDELTSVLTARIGRPEHVLAEYAQEVDADLFVIGGRRHPVPTSWFGRGTAHHLLRVGDRPILITGPQGLAVRRVVVAVDISFAAKPTVDVARALGELLGVGLEAVHVITSLSAPRRWGSDAEAQDLLEAAEERASREVWPLLPEGTPRSTIHGETVHSIRRAVQEGPATLLVVGAQGRGRIDRLLLGSTTEALLSDLPCTLAIVPAKPPTAK